MNLKKLLKKILPTGALSYYHLALAHVAAAFYGYPSEKLTIVGITGTKGKTTAANFIWACLQAAGHKTGLIGTANIRLGDEERLNEYHMTMPGPLVMQKLLAEMVKAGCTHAVFEVTSEGVNQWRHAGINFDFAVFTNLTPEHLPSHGGSFENYKAAKGKFFSVLAQGKQKVINGEKILKTILANADSEHADYFLSFTAERKLTFGLSRGEHLARNIFANQSGVTFELDGEFYKLNITGAFNVLNALPGILIAKELGAAADDIRRGLEDLETIPGRMERIDLGQPFTLFVDYAHEKESITAALKTARDIVQSSQGKVIILLGAEGGGRDPAKRPIMGELAARLADYAVVSNVDPYEDDPTKIAEDIAQAAEKAGLRRGTNLFVILDRRAGIRKTLELAHPGDVVLVTGKGAEQSIVINGKSAPWDDRRVVKEELEKLLSASGASAAP
ncbi:MAG: UDP-N-acetylmuramoyl-L-alanyl-D-glutamate--2,6-diaminopimelate ligase [Patescibacteria group bacterium]